ncbi:MAG: transporter [bacterium]
MRNIQRLVILFWLIAFVPGQTALGADCTKADEWYQKGLSLSDNSSEEMSCYQKAIELCPEDAANAHERLGNIYKARRQWNMAIKELLLACEKSGGSSPHTSLGEVYRMQGEYELAIREFQTALDIDAGDKAAQASLEYIYRMVGRDDAKEQELALVPAPIFGGEPGLALPKGWTLINLQLQSSQIRREWVSPVERSVNIWKFITGIRYGLTNDFMVGIIPKILWKKAYIHLWEGDREQEYEPSAYGLGDTILLLKYCFWYRKKTSWSASLNINVPTGDENKTVLYGGRSFSIPLGSGKYEFMPGIAFSTSFQNFGHLHANLRYFFTQERDDGLDPGDEISYNFAFGKYFPLIGEPYFLSMPVTGLVLQMELNGVYLGESTGYEARDEQLTGEPSQVKTTYHGGHTLSWSPGVQLIFSGNTKLEIGVQIPFWLPPDPWITEPVYQIGVSRLFF